jgi:hypothetical protein
MPVGMNASGGSIGVGGVAGPFLVGWALNPVAVRRRVPMRAEATRRNEWG